MSTVTRALLPAVSVIALCGVATSSALATEAPFYKVSGSRLKAGETREAEGKPVGNLVLKSAGAGITITCTGAGPEKGATINGSEPGEPGTGTGVTVFSGCTVAGNGEKCVITSVKGAKDKKVVTNTLKSELVLSEKEAKKGTKILGLVTPASGSIFVVLKFEAEAGGKCTFAESSVEGSGVGELLNSKKEPVAFEEHEAEESFGFGKSLPNGTEACKIKESKLDKCVKASLKAFGVATTTEGTGEGKLTSGALAGVFSK